MDLTSREDLSALMDGELAAEPTRFLLRRLDHDPELSATWSRWHLIRACLASDSARMSAPAQDDDFAARIATALQAEVQPAVRQRHWVRYIGGGALAAGVAMAALVLNGPNPHVGAPAAVAESRPIATPVTAPALAAAEPTAAPWSLSRQPTVLSVQPASADIVYGTGLMQPEYLRRAGYARDAAMTFPPAFQTQSEVPFSIVSLPEPPPPGSSAATH